jgi:cephalosporin-C deacetylase
MLYNIENPQSYYYKLAYLDCLRAMQFLLSRPEVDTRRVATEGGSQGGLFAIATAALEPKVACVCSNVTAFSDYPDGMQLGTVGHHSQFRTLLAEDSTSTSLMKKSLAYTDGVNMATLVKCPVQINMGGVDPVCPYICGIVLRNRLAPGAEREYNVFPDAKHEVPGPMRQANARFYEKYLRVSEGQ